MADELLQYAVVDLDDPITGDETGRKEGRLLTIGSIEHGLSDAQGNMKAGTVDLALADVPDRPIGTRLANPTKKFFVRDSLVVKARSAEGRIAGVVPRILGRMLLTDSTYTGPLAATFQAVDPFFIDTGIFGPDKKFPFATIPTTLNGIPIYVSTPTGSDPVTTLNGPADVFSTACPVILGEKSDEGAKDPNQGSVNARGLCPLYYVGQDMLGTGPDGAGELWGKFVLCQFACYQVISLYGLDLDAMLYGIGSATSDGATQSTITLPPGTDLSFVLTTGANTITLYTLTKGIVTAQIVGTNLDTPSVTVNLTVDPTDATNIDWLISPALPCRGPVNLLERNGVDVMVPKWPNYIRPTPYEDVQTESGDAIRLTLIWVRGPMMWAHINGQVTLAANVIGVEDQGDGSGLPITDYFTAYYWWYINCVIANTLRPGGVGFEGKYPQTDGDIAAIGGAWEDGTYKVRGSSFAAMQAWSRTVFPGGFKISAWFGEQKSLRDVAQLWNDNGACRTGENEPGQIFVAPLSVDITLDPTTWPRIEHVSRVFGDVRRTNPSAEIETTEQGQCDFDPDGQTFRQPLQKEEGDGSGVLHNKGIRVLSKLINGSLTSNPDQFRVVLQTRWAYAKDGPVYVTFPGDHGLVDYPLGSGIQFTSIEGPGALGYVDQPMIILDKAFDFATHLVTYTCLNVGDGDGMNLLVPADEQSIISDDTSVAGVISDDATVAAVLV